MITLFIATIVFFVLVIVISLVVSIHNKKNYENSSYYQSTHTPYWDFDKGSYGEYELYQNLQFVEEFGWRFLFNVYLPKSNGQTTEIDIILLSSKGIFVFESKNYGGQIFGSEDDTHWTQSFPNGNQYKFYNPINQNDGHIYHLKKFLNSNIPFYSIVAFSDRCSFFNVNIYNKVTHVVHYRDVPNVVRYICEQTPSDCLDFQEINKIYNTLYFYSQVPEYQKHNHAEQTYYSYRSNFDICPWCGGRLQLRTTQKGKNKGNKFYGCSNFPRCQYIKHIDNQ